MKFEDYVNILDENLQISVQNLDLGRRYIFQQDNDPKHTSKSVTIENQWQELKVRINLQSPKSFEEWKKIPEKICLNLMKILRKRLQQVVKMRVN